MTRALAFALALAALVGYVAYLLWLIAQGRTKRRALEAEERARIEEKARHLQQELRSGPAIEAARRRVAMPRKSER